MPMIPLRGLTVLPTMVLHFDISKDKFVKAVEAAMAGEQIYIFSDAEKTRMITVRVCKIYANSA